LSSNDSNDSDKIAIIGAGPGGLCAARWLQAHDIPFDLLERNKDVGGLWDIDAPGSPIYESAHFISSKTLSGFRDFPMPDDYPDYPSHRLILGYLRKYAERHGTREKARFGVRVKAVRPEATEGGLRGWRLVLESGETRRYAGVIVATGLQWTPKQPALPGQFEGEAIHSAAYKSTRQLAGKRVLVVGGGNSGCDIAVDAGQAAAKAFLSVRRGYWFIPKHVFGVPADVFGDSGPQLPAWLEQRIFQPLLRALVGDLRRYGLPRPDHRLFETHPVLNSQILHSLSHGDVKPKPDVKGFEGRRVTFADGSAEEIDLVIFATGYRRKIEILPEGLHKEGDVSQLFLNAFHRSQPDLFVVGFFETDAGAYPLIDLQCELIAKLLRLRRAAPKRLAPFEQRLQGPPPDFSGGVRFLQVERMTNYVRSHPYKRYLAAAIADLGS
jgi:cation diffusion facilitator CzcD-associated flavoprotein CzcO